MQNIVESNRILVCIMRPLLSNNRKEKDDEQKKQNSENCSVFLFSDDLIGLAAEEVV